MQNAIATVRQRGSDRRRPDWKENDRRQTWPWVVDSNDRRSGEDRRVKERRVRSVPSQKFPPNTFLGRES